MAKDVSIFLSWASEPEHDQVRPCLPSPLPRTHLTFDPPNSQQRKKMGFQAVIILSALTGLSIWVKKFKWTPIKTRKIVYNPPK